MVHIFPCCKDSYKCFQTMASHLVNCRKAHRRRLQREARVAAAAAAAATADAASQDAALHDATKVVAETLDLEDASGWARSSSKENFKCHIKRALNMSDEGDYRCFVGGLSWSTSNRALKDAFSKFGHLVNAKVVLDKESGRSRGFGFITFDNKHAMDDAIEAMDGINLHGRNITVAKAQPRGGSGRDYDGDHSRDRRRDRGPCDDCFKCGKPGHFARECLTDRDTGGSYGGRDDRYGGIRGSGCARFGPDRNGDRNSGRLRDSGRGGDRNSRDRSGLYERYSDGFR